MRLYHRWADCFVGRASSSQKRCAFASYQNDGEAISRHERIGRKLRRTGVLLAKASGGLLFLAGGLDDLGGVVIAAKGGHEVDAAHIGT